MGKPLISGDLVDAAAALLLCQHDSPLITLGYDESKTTENTPVWNIEGDLAAARSAASAYLVAVFDAALTWNDDDE